MLKCLGVIGLAFFLSGNAHAAILKAVPFPEIGTLQDAHRAAFAIFQTYSPSNPITPAVTSCDITTGACTGQGAGTGLFTAATCDGVADDRNAFNSFNAWAQASLTNANGQLLELVVPSGKTCIWLSGNVNNNSVMNGIKNGRLWAYGATFQSPSGNGFRLGPSSAPGGICQRGINDVAGCSARINTVSAGATSVTINTTGYSGSLSTLCSRFVPGQWAAVTGFDLQGVFGDYQGEPPNPHFFDFVQIGSTSNCTSTGQIQLGSALTNTYLSTWPNWSSGNGLGSDKGGPATIYALTSDWGGATEIRGLTVDVPSFQTNVNGRSVTLRDVVMTGAPCVIPSQNDVFTMINSTGTSCGIEVDKLINQLNYSGTTLNRLQFQSSSTNVLNWDGGSLISDLNGTPKVANVSNLTTPIIRLGPYAYGPATSATCTNCSTSSLITGFGVSEGGGPSNPGTNFAFAVSSGVFSYPMWTGTVTGMADNGSGKIRVTVADTTGFIDGTYARSGAANAPTDNFPAGIGLFSSCSAPSPCNSPLTIGNITPTTMDITNFNFADVVWSGAGYIRWGNGAEQTRWAVPGTNFGMTGASGPAKFYQASAVTRSGNFVNMATTVPGGYPTVPLTGGKSFIRVQAPKWTCTNCSGTAQMVDFSGAPPNIPIFSYSKRSYTNLTPLVNSALWGKVSSIKVNVTQAYTGATSPMRFNLVDQAITPAGAFGSYNAFINLRQAGLRTITPAGVTCDTGGGPVAGACSGDTGLTLADPDVFFSNILNLAKPDGSPTDQPWAMDYEFIMDQGVVP